MAVNTANLAWTTVVARLAIGGGLGLLIGVEREIDGHEAGARTHALLALGAALFGAISVGAFDDFIVGRRASTNVQVDVTRVASYVAAGIGFLGAGAILKRGSGITGLTTAASLWVAAAVGLAAGLGFWAGAIAAATLALVALVADRPIQWLAGRVADGSSLVVSIAADRDAESIVTSLARELPEGTRLRVERVAVTGEAPRIDVSVHVRAPQDRALVLGYVSRPDVLMVTSRRR